MKRSKYDAIFSKLVKERADFNCETCGKNYRHNSQGLHCSHIFSRRHARTRYDPDNALAQCFGCHSWFGGNPWEASAWLEEKFGEGYMEILREKKNMIYKWTTKEKEEMYRHYKKELRRLEEEREFKEGRIEFEGWL